MKTAASIFKKGDKTPKGLRITTYKGEVAFDTECIFTENQYVKKDDPDLIEIEGRQFLKTSKNVAFDNSRKEFFHFHHTRFNILPGIISVSYEKSEPYFEYGWFSSEPLINGVVYDHIKRAVMNIQNVEELRDNLFAYSIKKGCYFLKTRGSHLEQDVPNVDYRRKGYSIEENKGEFELKCELFKHYKPVLNKNIRNYTQLLGPDLSFGLEVETISGHLPEHMQYRAGTVICRDGSLTIAGTDQIGAEYVTVPMKGTKGVANIQYLMTELQKRCEMDLKCSMHIHFGGFSTDRGYLVALYNLSYQIQDELFKMFPFYKTQPEGIKSKNYNQKVTDLFKNIKYFDYKNYVDTCYKKLFHFLAGGINPNRKFNRREKHHPAGSKWNIASRYYWINFNNAIFSKRNTIEFRLHTPTLNYMKTVIWLFMCNAIIRFAEKHEAELIKGDKKFTLKDVFFYYSDKGATGDFVANYLWEYYKHRVELFQKDYKAGDYISKWDIVEDHKFTFTYAGIGYWF